MPRKSSRAGSAYRRSLEPVGASDLIEPYRAAISKVPGVAKVRAVIRERRTLNERFEFTVTLFSDFQEPAMRDTVFEAIDFILLGFVNSRRLRLKDNSFTVV